jgi:AmmeMemoRadiSam system protein B
MSSAARTGIALAVAAGAALAAGMAAFSLLGEGEAGPPPPPPEPVPEPSTGHVPFYHPTILPRYRALPSDGVRARFVIFRAAGENRQAGFEIDDPLRIAGPRLILTEEAREIHDELNGRPLEEVLRKIEAGMGPREAAAWRRRTQEVVRALDENFLLENARFGAEVLRRIEAFRSSQVRECRSLGRLERSEIESRLDASEGRGARALIVPHIDYRRGAEVYGIAYSAWRGRGRPGRVVILGTSHAQGAHYFALTRKTFRTPFGELRCDREFVDRISRSPADPWFVDEFLHRDEHSIELQLPWLQAVFGDVPIVPVLCGSLQTVREGSPANVPEIAAFLGLLSDAARESPGETLFLAASDLSHMGDYFGDDSGFPESVRSEVEEADRALLQRASALDAEGVFQGIRREGNPRRICGGAPIYVLATLLERLGGASGRTLAYRQCVDLGGRRMVSIAAAAFD